MLNIVRSRAAIWAGAALALSTVAVGGAAYARSMPYDPAPVVATPAPFGSFAGKGRGWSIDIRAHRAGDHSVRMRLRDGSEWRGTLRYGGRVMDMPNGFVVMSGELRNGLAMLPVTVEINPRQRCRTGGARGPDRIVVHGAEQQPLHGCGAAGRFGRYR